MKLYIHRLTGFLSAKPGAESALQTVAAVLGSTLELDCVFYADDNAALDLAPDAIGVFVAKQSKQYTSPALVQALSWTKAEASEDGYRFTLRPASAGLVTLLADQDSVALMAQIAWTENGVERKTPKFALAVGNAVYRDDEPVVENPDDAWPLPGALVTTAALAQALAAALTSGDVRIPNRDDNNTLNRLVVKDGQLQLESIA